MSSNSFVLLLLAHTFKLFYPNEFKSGDFEFSSVSGYPVQKLLSVKVSAL